MNIRLNQEEIATIKASIHKFDPSAKIYLFGSRTHKNKKGGDIDLLVISDIITQDKVIDIKLELFKKIEEQKIDMIIAADDNDLFVKIALRKGVLL